MIPPDSPAEAAKKMKLEIEDKIDDIVWAITQRRRSDSNELPVGFMVEDTDCGAEEQVIEADMIDF